MSFTNNQNSPFLSQQEELQVEDNDTSSQQKPKKSTNRGKKSLQARPRKPGKNYRHSKINTAQGPRDRRMRLSLQIARKFFDLQDMLGFDKASKTIDWLFTKSKAAMKELMGNTLPSQQMAINPSFPILECEGNVVDTKYERKCRSMTARPHAKECRDMARARARDRTREKMNIRSFEKSKKYFEQNPKFYVGCSSNSYENFESSGKSSGYFEDMDNNKTQLERRMATVGIIDKLLGMECNTLNISSDEGLYLNDDFQRLEQGDWSNVENNAKIEYTYCAMMDHINANFTGDHVCQQENPSSSANFITTSNLGFHESHFLGN